MSSPTNCQWRVVTDDRKSRCCLNRGAKLYVLEYLDGTKLPGRLCSLHKGWAERAIRTFKSVTLLDTEQALG